MGLFLCCQCTQRAEMGMSPGRRSVLVIVVVTSRALTQVLIRLKKVSIISLPHQRAYVLVQTPCCTTQFNLGHSHNISNHICDESRGRGLRQQITAVGGISAGQDLELTCHQMSSNVKAKQHPSAAFRCFPAR